MRLNLNETFFYVFVFSLLVDTTTRRLDAIRRGCTRRCDLYKTCSGRLPQSSVISCGGANTSHKEKKTRGNGGNDTTAEYIRYTGTWGNISCVLPGTGITLSSTKYTQY